jgi:hypothetical protein
MKRIRLSEAGLAGDPADEALWKGKRFSEDHLLHVASDEDTVIEKPDGSVLAMLLKRRLTAPASRVAYGVLRRIESQPTNRSLTVIGKSGKRLKSDGSRGNTTAVSASEFPELRGMSSAIIGYYDRHVRWPYCRATAFNLAEPEKFESLMPYVREVEAVFHEHAGERYAAQRAVAEKTHPAWLIPGTPFTTITVNRNYAAACHQDAGDLKAGFGVMTAFRSGEYSGGVTYFPAFRAGVSMSTGDVCLADVHEWHGVTDLRGVPGRYERVSCVFYYREKMCRCGSPEEEALRAKNRKLGDPLYDKVEK